jgi:hypothetical protein
MATTASRILNSTAEVEEGRLLQLLLGSWFNRRFTEQIRIGTKNEDAILAAFKNHSNVTDMFSCGLLESKHVPWLAASPNAIAVVKNPHGGKVLATVDMKTRVAPKSITEAETIAARWNNKLGQAGTSNTTGRIIYTVFLCASTEILNEFVSSLITMLDNIKKLNDYFKYVC